MKKLFVVLAVAIVVSLVAAGAAMAGIANTKHNLANSTTNTFRATNTGEICVFCHTPHQTGTVVQPLWNRNNPTNAFTAYGTTLAGTTTVAPGATSVTRLCFGCHDGVTALNALNNPPNDAGGTVTMSGGANVITGNAVLDFDLSNDHPVGIRYNAGTASLRTLTVATNAALIRVTAVNTVTGDAATSSVECASCHEPHTDANPAFLPVTNAASALCITCHIK